MKKRILSLALCLAMVMTMFAGLSIGSAADVAESTVKDDISADQYYHYYDEEDAEYVEYNCERYMDWWEDDVTGYTSIIANYNKCAVSAHTKSGKRLSHGSVSYYNYSLAIYKNLYYYNGSEEPFYRYWKGEENCKRSSGTWKKLTTLTAYEYGKRIPNITGQINAEGDKPNYYNYYQLGTEGKTTFYYLTKDLVLDAPVYILGTVHLCLNGYTITQTEDCEIFYIPTATIGDTNITTRTGVTIGKKTNCTEVSMKGAVSLSALYLYDCVGTGKLVGGNNYKGGAVVNCGIFMMYGGTITDCSASYLGGAIGNWGFFGMYGGTIDGCSAEYGGAVYTEEWYREVEGHTVFSGLSYLPTGFYMAGGTISNCSAYDGGAVYNWGYSSLNYVEGLRPIYPGYDTDYDPCDPYCDHCDYFGMIMTGGTIDHCDATLCGGGICNESDFYMTGGTISNCSAYDGGGIFNGVQYDYDDDDDDLEPFYLSAVKGLANLEIEDALVEIDDIYVINPRDIISVYIYYSSRAYMAGGTIDGCTAGYQGGGVLNEYQFCMTDGIIKNCSAVRGGGVENIGESDDYYYWNDEYRTASAFYMDGGSILNCEATERGGGVENDGNDYAACFFMKNATIANCTCDYENNSEFDYTIGGGVFTDGYFKMDNSTIKGCTASFGGGVYARKNMTARNFPIMDSIFYMNGSEITDCDALVGGGAFTGEADDGWVEQLHGVGEGNVYEANYPSTFADSLAESIALTLNSSVEEVTEEEVNAEAVNPEGFSRKNETIIDDSTIKGCTAGIGSGIFCMNDVYVCGKVVITANPRDDDRLSSLAVRDDHVQSGWLYVSEGARDMVYSNVFLNYDIGNTTPKIKECGLAPDSRIGVKATRNHSFAYLENTNNTVVNYFYGDDATDGMELGEEEDDYKLFLKDRDHVSSDNGAIDIKFLAQKTYKGGWQALVFDDVDEGNQGIGNLTAPGIKNEIKYNVNVPTAEVYLTKSSSSKGWAIQTEEGGVYYTVKNGKLTTSKTPVYWTYNASTGSLSYKVSKTTYYLTGSGKATVNNGLKLSSSAVECGVLTNAYEGIPE